MDNPGDAKYGLTRPQMTQAFRRLKELGAEEFGIHAFLASNTISNEYYPALAAILFRTAVELKEETGCHITFINLSGRRRTLPPGTARQRYRGHRRGGAESL
jgi:diaminopimelate decarboxylase